ncbi:hypothetical protein C6501_00575 [Candidatus Poribacteria bacterium]|nr:MAG: hypothetical protein C6501_00575 [Candidatus Poribacteria bacterium]
MGTKVTVFLSFLVVSSAFCAVDIQDVTFGFNNGYKAGKWAPLNVTVRSQHEPSTFNGELAVEVRNLYSDKPIHRYAIPLQLSKTDLKHKKLYIYCPQNAIKLFIQVVRTRGNDKEIIYSEPIATQELSLTAPIENKDYFVLVLAPSGDKLQKFIDKKQLDDDDAQAHIRYLPNSNAMPTRWIGYSAVDLMVIREVSLTERRISKQRQIALLEWVQRGGTLIVPGGANFRYLKDSFIEQYLPVKLVREETINKVPTSLQQQFGLNTPTNKEDLGSSSFKNIHFEPNPECHTLLGTDEQIYIAKRNFGSGQIISFAFDYNAPPFSDLKAGETFWRWLLKTHGKSPRLFADKYAPFRQHEDKIHKQFLSKMPTQIPLIKFLAVVLPIYLFSFGGFLLYFGKHRRSPQKRIRSYWIGGVIFVFVSVGAIGIARAVLPEKIETDRFSILSIYPEQKNAHLQSYISFRTTARTKTSIALVQNTFIRPLSNESVAKPPQFFQGSPFQLQEISLEPWFPSTYVKETFFPLDTQQSQITLENAWRITGEEAAYLGTVTLGSSDLWSSETSSKTINKVPPDEELDGTRKAFAQILQREGLLQYLLKPENALAINKIQIRTVLMGWTSQLEQVSTNVPLMLADENVTVNDETLVIMYLDEKDRGM